MSDWEKEFKQLWSKVILELALKPEHQERTIWEVGADVEQFISQTIQESREEGIDDLANKLLNTPDLSYTDIKYHQSNLKESKK